MRVMREPNACWAAGCSTLSTHSPIDAARRQFIVGAGANSTLSLAPALLKASGAGVPHWPCFIGSSIATSAVAGANSWTHCRNPAASSSGVHTSGGGGVVIAGGIVAGAAAGVAGAVSYTHLTLPTTPYV